MLTARTPGSAAMSRQSRVAAGEAVLRRRLIGPTWYLIGDYVPICGAMVSCGKWCRTRA